MKGKCNNQYYKNKTLLLNSKRNLSLRSAPLLSKEISRERLKTKQQKHTVLEITRKTERELEENEWSSASVVQYFICTYLKLSFMPRKIILHMAVHIHTLKNTSTKKEIKIGVPGFPSLQLTHAVTLGRSCCKMRRLARAISPRSCSTLCAYALWNL